MHERIVFCTAIRSHSFVGTFANVEEKYNPKAFGNHRSGGESRRYIDGVVLIIVTVVEKHQQHCTIVVGQNCRGVHARERRFLRNRRLIHAFQFDQPRGRLRCACRRRTAASSPAYGAMRTGHRRSSRSPRVFVLAVRASPPCRSHRTPLFPPCTARRTRCTASWLPVGPFLHSASFARDNTRTSLWPPAEVLIIIIHDDISRVRRRRRASTVLSRDVALLARVSRRRSADASSLAPPTPRTSSPVVSTRFQTARSPWRARQTSSSRANGNPSRQSPSSRHRSSTASSPRALSLARLPRALGALVASSIRSRTSFAYARGFDAMNALTRRDVRSPFAMSSLPVHRASSSSSVVENSFELKFIFPFPGKKRSSRSSRSSRVAVLAARAPRPRVAPRASLTLARSLEHHLSRRPNPSALVARDECARAFERMRARRECNA